MRKKKKQDKERKIQKDKLRERERGRGGTNISVGGDGSIDDVYGEEESKVLRAKRASSPQELEFKGPVGL